MNETKWYFTTNTTHISIPSVIAYLNYDKGFSTYETFTYLFSMLKTTLFNI